MRKFTVFALSSLGAVTLLAGTAAAGAAGLWMYSTKHADHSRAHARHAAFMERHVGELPECLELEKGCEGECPTVEVELVPAPATVVVPTPAPAPGSPQAPVDAAPAPLDRDEEILTLKAQLAAALQRIAELEAEQAPAQPESTPVPPAGGDF